ncbi:SAM-dependent DNA methyltransferase [Acidithiobacillus ferridurans]|uniref:class I SAM-dependent DNA methyltransferase n=1 Tax=Acidithiobacillus ferridurans TaxID=1232575 RepID=UPI001C077C55|nr:class I SAM-dependent DNA methyltransferase [Acidithiobacillus ferridurans]MBU2803803.1 SAM-dependent DNA methyltransferase [Acidithiobacillus ferridurans]
MPRGPAKKKTEDTGHQSLESKLWATADKLRGHLDAADYKHVVLGLIFLKYISDRFAQRHAEIIREEAGTYAAEDRDEYTAEGVFWVPLSGRWDRVQAAAKQPDIGKRIDDAMTEIERENPHLKNILPKGYARPTLDQRRLGELVDLIGTIGLGTAEHQARDTLGRVYEYFLGRFASAEGKRGGEFYTPASVVRTLVTMLAPYKGRIYDPCCGSGGMFVQSEKFIEAHGGKVGDISVYGEESNPNTWKLALMNLAIRGIEADLGPEAADTFHKDLHPDLRADYILANPPFNISDWGGDLLRDDKRWQYGIPPTGNANFAWVQHMVHHLAPYGIAGFVLANGSMSSNTSGEGEIRKNLIEADLVDCMVALPGQLFYSTQIPVCLWFLAKNRDDGRGKAGKELFERSGEVLFIDARNMGFMADRTHRELSDADIQKIADTYHNWRGDGDGEYADIPGFCKAASLDDIRKNGHVLTPGRYVGAAAKDDDGEPFEEKMARLTKDLSEQLAEGRRLEEEIRKNLGMLGYDI